MVEVGILSVKGTLDTTNIERGQNRVRQGFKNVKEEGNNTFLSLNRLDGLASGLSSGFTNLAIAGTAALTGLASFSPQLAPSFAKFKTDIFQLSTIVGEKLRPAFESAQQKFSSFVDFLGSGTGLGDFALELGLLVGAGGLLAKLSSSLLGIKGLGKIIIPVALAISIQKKIEKPVSNIITKGLEKLGVPSERTPEAPMIKSSSEIGSSLGTFSTNLAVGAAAGAGVGALGLGIGALPGALIGGILGASKGLYEIIKEDYFNGTDTTGYS